MSFFEDIDIDSNFLNNNYIGLFDGQTNDSYVNIDTLNNVILNEVNVKAFKIIHVNIRSLPAHGDEFVAYLDTLKLNFDCVCFSETWLNAGRHIEDLFPDYMAFHSMREPGRLGGGTSIYLHNRYVATHMPEISCNLDHIECVFIKIKLPQSTLVIGSCYRKPISSNASAFINDISRKISSLDNEYMKILCGDWNFDLLQMETDSVSAEFMDTMLSLGLVHTISKPTRITDSSVTLIDNIFISNNLHYSSGVLPYQVSDHFPIFALIHDIHAKQNTVDEIKYRLINNSTLDNLAASLLNYSFDDILNSQDIDFCIEKLHNILLSEFYANCPVITKRIFKRDKAKPWINGRIKHLIRNREKSYLQYRQNLINFASFKRYRNYVTGQISFAKKQYFSNLLYTIKKDMKKTWRIFNNLIKPGKQNKNNIIESLLINGCEVTDNTQISNAFNDHFSTVGRNISQSFERNQHAVSSPPNVPNSFFFRAISDDDVIKIIINLKNKSCNIDTYPAKVLKHLSYIISPILADIINKSLSRGYFPKILKIARVIPLHKDKSKNDVNNYRPISCLPLLSKIFERIVHNQLYSFLEKYNLISPDQYGFRKKRSTTDAIMDQLDFIYKNLDNGDIVISIFMDYSKAFDCLDHIILSNKLDANGIRGIAKQWFISYLSNRLQYVSVNNTNSSLSPITHGVPQGSILGPLLFLLFINDFPSVNRFFKTTLFADDSTLTCKFDNKTNHHNIVQRLESELEPVYNWLVMNKIKINYDKSKFIVYSYRKRYELGPLKFGNSQLHSTDNTKFLGLIIDKNLNFKAHVASVSNKISKVVGVLYRLNKILSIDHLNSIYSALLVPHIMYCLEIWYGSLQGNRDRIFKLQKKAVRAINLLPYNEHTHDAFKSMGVLKLDDLSKLMLSVFIFKQQNMVSQSDVHSHYTRHRNNLVVPFYNLSRTQTTWLYQSTLLWGSVPDQIKDTDKIGIFKSRLKKFLLSSY